MGILRRLGKRLDGWTTWGGGAIADEASAYLEGRLLEHQRMLGAGGRTPAWMWLNGVVHGDVDRLTDLATDAERSGTPGSWRAARAMVAAELLERCHHDADAVRAAQREVLVPLEGRVSDIPDLTPARLHGIVLREMWLLGT
jgi:hypothetical protein